MQYHFKTTKETKGYSASCIELPGCITQGDTKEELMTNMQEALDLYLDEPADSKSVFPLPKKRATGKNIIQVAVSSKIAFAFALRRTRLSKKLTQAEAALLIGFSGSLSNYQRLENSRTANPVLETLVRIKRAFPDFPLEQIAS